MTRKNLNQKKTDPTYKINVETQAVGSDQSAADEGGEERFHHFFSGLLLPVSRPGAVAPCGLNLGTLLDLSKNYLGSFGITQRQCCILTLAPSSLGACSIISVCIPGLFLVLRFLSSVLNIF